jgi:hypothetical protein
MNQQLINGKNPYEEICRRASNRCNTQHVLYETYFKPKGITFEKSRLCELDKELIIRHPWTVHDHNHAVKLIKVVQNNLEEFKKLIPKMDFHEFKINLPDRCEYWHFRQNIEYHNEERRKCYQQIIEYYEKTGFLEELSIEI